MSEGWNEIEFLFGGEGRTEPLSEEAKAVLRRLDAADEERDRAEAKERADAFMASQAETPRRKQLETARTLHGLMRELTGK